MKIALFGMGRMGHCIAYLLRKVLKEDLELVTFDKRDTDAQVSDRHVIVDMFSYNFDPFIDYGFKPDLVLSSLPYFHNFKLAKLAIEYEIPYFDLGGSVPVCKQINSLAREKEAIVFTDLGLAPGWVNILAEEAYQIFKKVDAVPYEIIMRCGGLPENPHYNDPFKYKLTWSKEGLYNEYAFQSEALINGKIKHISSLNRDRDVKLGNANWQHKYEYLESFFTSGGASHTLELMKNRGVHNCSYQTLRFPGHAKLVNYFINIKGYSCEEFNELFMNYNSPDIVVLNIEARTLKETLKYNKTILVKATKDFSAMQLATSGGFVAAVLSSFQSDRPLSYADVDIVKFNKIIKELKIVDINSGGDNLLC